jgi:hypothetical protein
MVTDMVTTSQPSFFGRLRPGYLVVVLLFLLGFGIRMLDLTDLPLDFNPARQLFSAIKARGMYYQYASDIPGWQRQIAIEEWKAEAKVEPPVIETIVTGMYLVFGEHPEYSAEYIAHTVKDGRGQIPRRR